MGIRKGIQLAPVVLALAIFTRVLPCAGSRIERVSPIHFLA